MAITTKQIKDAMNAPPTPQADIDARHERHQQMRQAQREKDKAAAKPLWYDSEENELVFRSGRRVYVFTGQISITSDGQFELGYGEDGGIRWPANHWSDDEPTDNDLTADDMRELADMMIARWTAFRETLQT